MARNSHRREAKSRARFDIDTIVRDKDRMHAMVRDKNIARMHARIVRQRIIITIFILFILQFIDLITNGYNNFFITQFTIFIVMIFILPILVKKNKKQIFQRLLLEALFASALALLFTTFTLHSTNYYWIVYFIPTLFLLEAGGIFINYYKEGIEKRIKNNNKFDFLAEEIEIVNKNFNNSAMLYLSVPLSLLISIPFSIIYGYNELQFINSFIIIFCLLFMAFLSFFSFKSCLIISQPLLDLSKLKSIEPTKREEDNRKFFVGSIKSFFLKQPKLTVKNYCKEDYINFAIITTDTRKIIFFDSMHNVTLIVILIAILNLLLVNLNNLTVFIITLILSIIIFCQIPYAIGQYQMHKQILSKYEGVERKAVHEKLKEYAPIMYIFDIFPQLIATGSFGAILYYILVKLFENKFI